MDRIVREHNYAMSEKLSPTSAPAGEIEYCASYRILRIPMSSRTEKQRLLREEVARRSPEPEPEPEQRTVTPSEGRKTCDLRQTGLRRRHAVFDFVRGRDLPRVDAMNISLSRSVLERETEWEERVAGELLNEYRSRLPGHDVFPVFIGMRLRIESKWGRVIAMNREHCVITISGTRGHTNIDWERTLRCFAAGSCTADTGTGDDNILNKLRFEFQDIWPEEWDFPFVTGARLCVKGKWGVILKTTVKRAFILLDGQQKAGNYFWEPILKEQKKLRQPGIQ
ncbi:MAG TPA: hypothetical protein VE954_41735 [Oligoflexus sp.]|uniref:hypothetical protein n=1 Tax=Oligoflexus sp. TaxID=1971216 RepID=UPI002D312BE1|nr:hypothetical protein [Oligoflexus sp.]HYX39664.1 hypothetical protein [Oligoflexus sp.]